MTRYEVKGTDEFFLHIRDNEEWPEDKAEAYIGDIWKTVDILNKQDQQIKKTKEVLQKHYDYAYDQRQENLENAIVAEVYNVLRYTVAEIADELGIAIKK